MATLWRDMSVSSASAGSERGVGVKAVGTGGVGAVVGCIMGGE